MFSGRSIEHGDLLGQHVAALLHEGAEGEPQAVADGEVVGQLCLAAVNVPLLGAESTNEEQHHAHSDEGKNCAQPDLLWGDRQSTWVKHEIRVVSTGSINECS